jgi:hypothetical protein
MLPLIHTLCNALQHALVFSVSCVFACCLVTASNAVDFPASVLSGSYSRLLLSI